MPKVCAVKRKDDNKDTIISLQKETYILGQKIRPRLIAAILRFADELAEDSTRAAKFMLDNEQLPEGSEVFHRYAESLKSVAIDKEGSTIDLKFFIPKELATKKFGKLQGEAYLIDEIFDRTTKMHLERLYCMRFTASYIDIESINVTIEIAKDTQNSEIYTITYQMKLTGYPEIPKEWLFNHSPELKDKTGEKVHKLLSEEKKNEEAA